ncbi:IclR family transcriptional regulator [Streptomyces sp. CA-132043]|uniref:IclR family transcriptional regulator n=1 Tax=Streptomyces sp. CA-132043 TaxID=3240048 RepID=UPI003D8D4E6A
MTNLENTVNTPSAYRAPAVAQAFALLDELAGRSEGLRLSDLVRELDLPKSTVHRVLATLHELGVVAKEDDGRYVLGARLAAYARPAQYVYTGLIAPFYAVAERIRDKHDETIQLGVLTGAEVTFVAFVETTQPVRLFTRVGRRLPAYASACGKAILAFRDEAALRPVLDAGLHPITPSTVHDEKQLRAELTAARHNGWASEVEETSRNLSCFSVPVLDHDDAAVAAVTACVPTNSVDPAYAERLLTDLRAGAEELRRYL